MYEEDKEDWVFYRRKIKVFEIENEAEIVLGVPSLGQPKLWLKSEEGKIPRHYSRPNTMGIYMVAITGRKKRLSENIGFLGQHSSIS